MSTFPSHVETSQQGLMTLQSTFKRAYKDIASEMNTATPFGVQRRKQILKQVDVILTDLNVNVNEFIQKEIPEFYKQGANQAVLQLQEIGAEVPVKTGFSVVHKQAIEALVSDTSRSFADAINGVYRSMTTLLNKEFKAEIRQRIASGLVQGSALKDATKSIKQAFLDEGITALRDKGGKTWQLDTYAEMLYRTKTVESRNLGLGNRMLENGYDLVQVSTHFSTHEECRVWEGKILSLTGNTPDYPTVDDAESEGLFHPNCRHAINAIATDLAPDLLAYNPITKKYEPGGGLDLAEQLGNE